MKYVTLAVSDELADALVDAADDDSKIFTIEIEDNSNDSVVSYEFDLKDVEDAS